MASLYNISQDILAIYDKIDQQEGEIFPEDEQALMITKEEFKEKLTGYNGYIGELNSNIDACKKEEARIKALRKSYEGRLDTTKKVVLTAVQQFGTQTKNGGWAIEFPTFKFNARRSEVVVEDKLRLEYLEKELNRLIRELYANGMLNPNIEWDIQGLCDTINANIKAEMEMNGEEDIFIPFTPMDLDLIDIEIVSKCKVSNLFRMDNGIANVIVKGGVIKQEMSIDKVYAKDCLSATQDVNVISCCHKETNYNLQIK